MAQRNNIFLGFPNRIDTSSLGGGSWLSTLPLNNIKNRLLARVARSTDATFESTQIVIDLGQPRKIDVIGLVNHNISLGGKIIFQASNDEDFETIRYTLEVGAWQGVADGPWLIDTLEWENDNYWTGTLSQEEIDGFTSISISLVQMSAASRYWRIRIEDNQNPDGFVQVGRIFIGPGVQPLINYSYGATLGFETSTGVEQSLSGAEFFDVREPVRVFRFILEHMKDDEAYANFLEMTRRAGIHGEILVIPDPDQPLQAIRKNFIGRMRTLNPLEQTMWMDDGVSNAMSFEIKELR